MKKWIAAYWQCSRREWMSIANVGVGPGSVFCLVVGGLLRILVAANNHFSVKVPERHARYIYHILVDRK